MYNFVGTSSRADPVVVLVDSSKHSQYQMMLKKINWSAVLILLVATVSAQDDSIGCYVPGACMRSLYASAMSTDDIGECVAFCKVNSDLLCKRIFTYMQYRLFKILLSVSVHMVFIYAVPLSRN